MKIPIVVSQVEEVQIKLASAFLPILNGLTFIWNDHSDPIALCHSSVIPSAQLHVHKPCELQGGRALLKIHLAT